MRKSEIPDGVFSVLLIKHGSRVFVVHDSRQKIMTFASTQNGASYITHSQPGSINWLVFAPKVASVTHESLQRMMLRQNGSAMSFKISNLSGALSGFELEIAAGNALYNDGYAPVLIA